MKYVVKTWFDDGHVTVQGAEANREKAEELAAFIEEDYLGRLGCRGSPRGQPVDWDGRRFVGWIAGDVRLYR